MRNLNIRIILFSFLIQLTGISGFAQKNIEEIISESQSAASPLFFTPSTLDRSLINLTEFVNDKETNVRQGLPNFFKKAQQRKNLKVAYIGGSITKAQGQYRNQSLGFIQQMFSNVKVTGINAGVSGSDAELGACRLKEQVLIHQPDLIFVEFAVNGGFAEGMEGIVRQIIKYDKTIDICFIYTVTSVQLKYYQDSDLPPIIKTLEKIAHHYNIPSIHLGMCAADLAVKEKLIIKGSAKDTSGKIIFSEDGVHPLPAGGGKLYAEALARGMVKLKNSTKGKDYALPKPLYLDNWEDAKMINPSEKMFSSGWEKIDPKSFKHLQQYKSWFPFIMMGKTAGDSFTFKFKGKAFGLFDIGGPESGQLDIYLDGKQVKVEVLKNDKLYSLSNSENVAPLNRFTHFSNNRYRGQYFLIQTKDDVHTVTFKISANMADKKAILGKDKQKDISENFAKYNQSVIYLGKILIRGEMIE